MWYSVRFFEGGESYLFHLLNHIRFVIYLVLATRLREPRYSLQRLAHLPVPNLCAVTLVAVYRTACETPAAQPRSNP